MKKLILIFVVVKFGFIQNLFAQKTVFEQPNWTIVKTNVLNIIAKKPTISIEKKLKENTSLELSYIQGEFKDYLFTDYYAYNGFTLRAKFKHDNNLHKKLKNYTGIYIGNLKRNIEREGGLVDDKGYFIIPYQNYTENSIRAGGTLGTMFNLNKIIVDMQYSVGYGRYITNVQQANHLKGYFDMQLAVMVGYKF